MNDNLPKWSGADRVYSNAYKMLKTMGESGHVSREFGRQKNEYGWGPVDYYCIPDDDMNNLIEALDKGDEEKIKGLMMLYRSYGFDKSKKEI